MAAMVATGVDTTARGLLMLMLSLRLLLRLATATATAMVVGMAAMAATLVATAVDTTARGRLRLSPAMAMAVMAAAMVATVVVMEVTDTAVDTDTARGLLSPGMATGATAMVATAGTTVSYHRIRRSELSQKQNNKNSHF